MLPHSKICILPWVSIETTPTGAMRPCCLATEEISDSGKTLTVAHGLKAAFHSTSMQQLRQQFLNEEKPSTCQRCWNEEAAGRTSKRQWHLRKFAQQTASVSWYDTKPEHLWILDLKLGNICNLKCRICGTWSSSRWAQEEIDYQSLGDPKQTRAYQQLKLGEWPRKTEYFWQDLQTLLPQIKYFEFTGGEPFLIKEHFDLLKTAVEQGYAGDISVHYNTNGTVWPEDLEQIWKHFKQIEVAFSIDNIGKRFEIERSGANWQDVCDNIQRVKQLRDKLKNIAPQICMTINIQNVYYFDQLCAWADRQGCNLYVNMLHDPPHMNIGRMTPAAKELVLNHLRTAQFPHRMQNEVQGIIRFIEQGPGSDGRQFVEFMKRTDANRKENFAQTHAEIAEAMGYDAS